MLPEAPARDANRVTTGATARHSDSAEAEGRPQAGPDSGLVEEETSHPRTSRITFPTRQKAEVYAGLSRQRRVRRLRRCVIAHADCVRDQRGTRTDGIFVTLTYRPGAFWNSRQVSRALHCLRQWGARRGHDIAYEWVMELTKAGRPHYHLIVWVPKGVRLPKFDDAGWWPHGMTQIQLARRPVGYLVKYASKGYDGDLPRGARLFGTGGDRAAAFCRHRAGLPRWLDLAATAGERLDRIPHCGWMERGTGAMHQSPYEVRLFYDEHGFVVLEIAERVSV